MHHSLLLAEGVYSKADKVICINNYKLYHTTRWDRHILHYEVGIYYTMASTYTTRWDRHILHDGIDIYYAMGSMYVSLAL